MQQTPRALTKIDFALARLGFYGWFHRRARTLSRRSVVRFVSLAGARHLSLSCNLLTEAKMPVAGSFRIDRRYFSLTGRAIEPLHSPLEATELVALPLELDQAQPVWLSVPDKAAFALVEFTRVTGNSGLFFRLNRRVGRLSKGGAPRSHKGAPQQSRDLHYLWHRLQDALRVGDEVLAYRLLERIRYLHDTAEARSVQSALFRYDVKAANTTFKAEMCRWL